MLHHLRSKIAAAALLVGSMIVVSSTQPVLADAGDPTTQPTPVDTPVDVCDDSRPLQFRCDAVFVPTVQTQKSSRSTSGTLPAGLTPVDIQAAYGLQQAIEAGRGAGRTVAVVDAYDDPTAEADLAVYRQTFGLPACTTANGCFRKVNQRGQAAPLPNVNASWAIETSLDLDAVSAACPSCKILLVEGDSASIASLPVAVDTAVALGADVVSNSYSVSEGASASYADHYEHPGVAITASSGDSGYELTAAFPASSPTVTAVGGTSLVRADNARGWSETVWAVNSKGSAAGSSCSAWFDKPAWQKDRACPGRTVADISAVADPRTGLAIYDSTPAPASTGIPTGWSIIGGTSLSSPLIGAMYAMAGNTGQVKDASGLYAHSGDVNDVVGGNNAQAEVGNDCPATSYICTALRGYDAPTGLGSPDGLGVFS